MRIIRKFNRFPEIRAGIIDALFTRADQRKYPETRSGREFRSLSLLEMAREFYESQGLNCRSMSRYELADLALSARSGHMGSSDFSSILVALGSKRLRDAYQESQSTYQIWARRAANAKDFKEITSVQLSSAPDLLKTAEAGEFKRGNLTDSGESYSLLTYGRILFFTRQAMLNDDLRGFDRLVSAFGASAKRLENRVVYAELTNNANMSDGSPLFHSLHANLLSGADSELSGDSLAAARRAMRHQVGLQGEELSLTPEFLIVPAYLEQIAYQLTSNGYVPGDAANINEFRNGGKAQLTPVIEPLLDQVSWRTWYLAASARQIDTVEYCYLDGADGPVIDRQISFTSDGVGIRCRLDFAAKSIDHRGLTKSVGS